MMTVPDELLMAYADGELTADEAKAVEQVLAQDPVLRARLEPFVETRMRLAYVFEHTLHEPVPDRLIAAIARASTVPAESQPRRPSLYARLREGVGNLAETYLPSGGMTPAFAAGAIALVLTSTAIGWAVGRFSAPSGLIQVAGSELLASGKLARTLETRRSRVAAASDSGDVSIVPVLSFRTQAGGICREYRITGEASGPNFAGLACRTGEGQWRLALHVETPSTPQSSGPYQTATSVKVPAIDALAETIIAGDAFGRDEEAELLANGWQPPPPAGTTYTPNR
ncbi:hypothetical protein [Hyphomicrobium sp. CS1GBMeth3]|uniref:anti-sigma factor family protein n=1 Tax=Hyphomicrobium sp. CS1GBMeth3 TaxID=1892845 RepID=UPI000930232D|nr:hypothetical protein [Hyphomicrobium sp. CS1GBMeth3]